MTQEQQYIPVRVQRSRKQKQSSPNLLETKYVGRPSRFGNPFKLGAHKRCCYATKEGAVYLCLQEYKSWLFKKEVFPGIGEPPTIDEIKRELKQKNLSCWCPMDQQCHADILLEIANS